MNIDAIKRYLLILLLAVGSVLFVDGIFLHKIKTNVQIIIAGYHIHHWTYGLGMIVAAAILLWFSRARKESMAHENQEVPRRRR